MAELKLASPRRLARSLFKRLGLQLEAIFRFVKWRSSAPLNNPADKQAESINSSTALIISAKMSGFHVCGVCSFFILTLLFFMFTLFYLDVVRLVSMPAYRSGILFNVDAIRSLARLNAGFVYDEHNSLAITTSQSSAQYSLPLSTIAPLDNQASTVSSPQTEDAKPVQNQSINTSNLSSPVYGNDENATDLQEVDYIFLQHGALTRHFHSSDTVSADFQEAIDRKNPSSNIKDDHSTDIRSIQKPTTEEVVITKRESGAQRRDEACNFFVGKWVQDLSYPLYNSEACPFIDPGFRCQENGRPDQDYLRWRWQPVGCDLPRFKAEAMLERLRGRRIVFVGDSIGRNQWESMLCMLAGGVKNKSRIYEANGQPISKHTGFLSFVFQDFDLRVEYYRSPFLVPHTRPPAHSPPNVTSTLMLDSMDWTSKFWLPAHLLVLNTGHWWTYEKTMRGGCYFQVHKHANTSINLNEGFSRAMKTWRQWVSRKVDFTKTQIFFRSFAPVHFSNGTWKTGGQCHEDTKPWPEVTEFEEYWTNTHVAREVARLQDEGARSKARKTQRRAWVQMLDITRLSSYRKDAHSSIYHVPKNEPRPMHRQDCSHWCLPGLPDVWNELLFANLSPSHFPS